MTEYKFYNKRTKTNKRNAEIVERYFSRTEVSTILVGKEFDLSPSRVAQIINRILVLLRANLGKGYLFPDTYNIESINYLLIFEEEYKNIYNELKSFLDFLKTK